MEIRLKNFKTLRQDRKDRSYDLSVRLGAFIFFALHIYRERWFDTLKLKWREDELYNVMSKKRKSF